MIAATHPDGRIPTLDILRGVAVMGILAMNIISFSMPEPDYLNPLAYGGSTGIDLAVWIFNFIFVDGKMRGLFSLLFGASMLLIIERAEAKGEDPAGIHYRRMFWLLLFGLLHLWLLWSGDILSHYALTGMIAYAFRKQSVARLLVWAVGLIVIEVALMTMIGTHFVQASHEAATAGASDAAVRQWENMRSAYGPLPPAKLAADLALHHGGYFPLVLDRLRGWNSVISTLIFTGPETLGYMLLGMAGLKSGFLTGRWELRRYRRWAATCYAATIPVFAILAYAIVAAGFDPAWVVAISFGATVPIRPFMIIGLAALVIILTRRGGALTERIAAAGRAAFTNYLGTSILMTTFFYGYGLGFYGDMSRAELYLVVLAVWLLILLWSKPWLETYRYGPLEWLWRSLARGAPQPLRRRSRV